MDFTYPCIYHYEEDGYWAEFPDFNGCFSQGDDLEEVLKNSKEALQSIILYYIEEEKCLPTPTNIKELKEENNTFTSYVQCNILSSSKLVKKTLTIPEWVNEVGIQRGLNFSKILTEAIVKEIKS